MKTLRGLISIPTLVAAAGLSMVGSGLWQLAPWAALVVVGAALTIAAVLAAIPQGGRR